ncbi:MAG: ribose-5-phosphate isomerase RpiA [Rubrobacter sp.]|nr:ribose-5-phosphate isomerase RpiA [Rubrobacter sp.]
MKRAAAERAVEEYVEPGMVVGLGTGSTAYWAIRRIGALLSSGELREVRGVATSTQTTAQAGEAGVPLVTLAQARPDLTLDGADEIDPYLNLIKGRGGALLREKIVAAAGGVMVVIADESKLVDPLGKGSVPVEVDPFGWESTVEALASLGCEAELRREPPEGPGSEPRPTDGGHYTVDCYFSRIDAPRVLEAEMKRIPGALETGLFLGLCRAAVVGRGGPEDVEVREAGSPGP